MRPSSTFSWCVLGGLLMTIVLGAFSEFAMAERVLVQAQSGAKGHAWLFGARGKGAGECWLVVPRHVISVGQAGKAMPFIFTDQSGRGGQSGQPVVVEDIRGGLSATSGQKDLAFARVKIGRQKGRCTSRLGLPAFTYQTAMRKASILTLKNLLSTSFGIFQARVNRASMDVAAGGLISFKALRSDDAVAHLKQGLSGSVAEIEYNGELYPFAMVLEVKREKQLGLALRFDLIRKAFGQLERYSYNTSTRTNKTQKAGFSILSFDADIIQNGVGPTSLFDINSCWAIKPRAGQNNMSVIIQAGKLKNGIKGLSVVQLPNCDQSNVELWIDQRLDSNSQWTRARNCKSANTVSGQPACQLDFWGERQLRITINSQTPVSLSLIKVY